MPSLVELWVSPLEKYPLLKHTSVQAYGQVFSYSEDGLQTNPVKVVPRPMQVLPLGITNKLLEDVVNFAYRLFKSEFKTYNVATKNCNHFANKLSNYLCGKDIPRDLLHQNWMLIGGTAAVVVGIEALLLSSFSGGSKNEQK